MKKAPLLLAATILFVGTTRARADENPKVKTIAAWTAQEVLPAPIESGAAGKESPPAPKQPAPSAKSDSEESCCTHNGGLYPDLQASCAKLKAWLFYCPGKGPGLCGCCKFQPCCTPELYTFFLCRSCGAAGMPGRSCVSAPVPAAPAAAAAAVPAAPCCEEQGKCCSYGQRVLQFFDRVGERCHLKQCEAECDGKTIAEEAPAKPAK